jgi:hypothetical protein
VTPTIADLRREYDEQSVGPLLYDLINRTVGATVAKYPAAIYSPDRVHAWTPEGRAAIAHGWAVERLLGSRRLLERDLDESSTIAQLQRRLRQSLREYLRDTLAPDGARTIRKRLLQVLAELESVRCVSGRPRTDAAVWALEGQEDRAPAQRRALERLAWEIPDDRLDLVRDHHPAMRTSPLIRTAGIELLARTVLASAGAARGGDLVAAVCSRLQLPDPGRLPASLDADDRLVERLADAGAEVERSMDATAMEQIAATIFDGLPAEVCTRIAAYLAAGEQEMAAAAALGVGRRTIRRAREVLRERIVEATPDAGTAIMVYDLVLARVKERDHANDAGTPVRSAEAT